MSREKSSGSPITYDVNRPTQLDGNRIKSESLMAKWSTVNCESISQSILEMELDRPVKTENVDKGTR